MAADILIVDDEADIRELIAGILQDEGFETRLAHNSDAALSELTPAQALTCRSRYLAAGIAPRWP